MEPLIFTSQNSEILKSFREPVKVLNKRNIQSSSPNPALRNKVKLLLLCDLVFHLKFMDAIMFVPLTSSIIHMIFFAPKIWRIDPLDIHYSVYGI